MKTLVTISLTLALLACGNSSDSNKTDKPWNGSPVGSTFVDFGEKRGDRSVKLKVHNFGKEAAWGYSFMLRYFDKDGKPLKVQPGTSFESDVDGTSMSGTSSDKLEPGATKEIEIAVGLNIPAEAAKAEVIVTKVIGANADKTPNDIWSAPYSQSWPEKPAASSSK